MSRFRSLHEPLVTRLRGAGNALTPLILRLIMGWEFWESGIEKWRGENWFDDIQSRFPFPFSAVPPHWSWNLAIAFEIGGALLLWLGLGTRLAAFSLLFLTFVATAAVHWPDMPGAWSDLLKGYAITDMGYGNFKLPLLFSVMLLPLLFQGAGPLSLDYLVARQLRLDTAPPAKSDAFTWALASALTGLLVSVLAPRLGAAMLVLAMLLGFWGLRHRFIR